MTIWVLHLAPRVPETNSSENSRDQAEHITLQAVAVLGLFPHNVEHRVDQLSSFGVVTLGPVVPGTGLAEHEVVRPEDLPVRSRSDAVHGPRLQIHEHGARHEPSTARLVVVDIDPLELQVVVALVASGRVDAVLGADDLPELRSDLVAALATLDVEDFTHFQERVKARGGRECEV